MEYEDIESLLAILEDSPGLRRQFNRVLAGYPAVQDDYNLTSESELSEQREGRIAIINLDDNPDGSKVYPGDMITLNGILETVAYATRISKKRIQIGLKS